MLAAIKNKPAPTKTQGLFNYGITDGQIITGGNDESSQVICCFGVCWSGAVR